MKIGVIGGGAWGTALAQVAARGDRDVLLWAREDEVVAAINASHVNSVFLSAVPLPESIRATGDIGELAGCDALLVVAPAQHVRTVLGAIETGTMPLVLCAKGIEAGTRLLVGEVARAVQPDAPIAVLSGPTFAHEVAAGQPTAVTLACEDEALGARLAERLAGPAFRTYASNDVIGAEIGGAVKNVLAIACGVVEGAGLGQNARAALIARGFAEMTRFGLGARRACGDARRTVRTGGSGADLLVDQLAQFLARRRPGPGARRRRADGRSPHRCRGGVHRAGAARGGARIGRGHAGQRGGVRVAGRRERHRSGRRAACPPTDARRRLGGPVVRPRR